jgi:hypothetical protein
MAETEGRKLLLDGIKPVGIGRSVKIANFI